MVYTNPNVTGITLNVNGLYIPIKYQRLPGWIKECLQEIHFKVKCTDKVKGQKKTYHVNSTSKNTGMAILISAKEDFK